MARLPAAAWQLYRFLSDSHDDHSHDDLSHTSGAIVNSTEGDSHYSASTAEDGFGHDAHSDVHAHSEFGVHITYNDLYQAIIFLVCIYVCGQIASRLLRMPALVGEIVAGILLGPPLANFVPFAEAWVMLGEIGLVLLVVEAGVDIDVSTLKLIGTRGMLIALVGSVLPIAIGIVLALAINGTEDVRAAIAAGATFGPTSLGIALNILRSGGILNTPVGQLIVSAAVVDDMIALIILSLLDSMTGSLTAAAIVVPIVSALAFLLLGGYVALYWIPPALERCVLRKVSADHHGKIEMAIMFAFVIAMMPATHYAKASYLMGAFISGLAFCTSHELHATFVRQFKRVLQWLMRIFFAASIGFQVPIKDFGSGDVIWQGLVFTAALLGKLAVGFMVPNFTQSARFTGFHLRDCLATGFSMAAEGEFAFVIAVFSVDSGLISKDLYASVVLAVLVSTIIPPFCLRGTISYYNKKSEAMVDRLAAAEMEMNHDLEVKVAGGEHSAEMIMSERERNERLQSEIENQRAVFLVIQTQSESRWGLLHEIMACLGRKLHLDIIDHRSWHPRGINTTLVNEVYCKDVIQATAGQAQHVLDERMAAIQRALLAVIDKKLAHKKKKDDDDDNDVEKTTADEEHAGKVKVQRWFPGVVEEVIENVDEKQKLSLEQRILTEASVRLDRKQNLQLSATKEKSVQEILAGMQSSPELPVEADAVHDDGNNNKLPTLAEQAAHGLGDQPAPAPRAARRKRRQKMRSTPVVGGGLFGETAERDEPDRAAGGFGSGGARSSKTKKGAAGGGGGGAAAGQWKPNFDFGGRSGYTAEIVVQGETYDVRINQETMKALRTGYSGDMLDSRGVLVSSGGAGLGISPTQQSPVNQLQGYVRNTGPLAKITEEDVQGESESETSSVAAPDGRAHQRHLPSSPNRDNKKGGSAGGDTDDDTDNVPV